MVQNKTSDLSAADVAWLERSILRQHPLQSGEVEIGWAELLAILATSTSIAIENARLYTDLETACAHCQCTGLRSTRGKQWVAPH